MVVHVASSYVGFCFQCWHFCIIIIITLTFRCCFFLRTTDFRMLSKASPFWNTQQVSADICVAMAILRATHIKGCPELKVNGKDESQILSVELEHII